MNAKVFESIVQAIQHLGDTSVWLIRNQMQNKLSVRWPDEFIRVNDTLGNPCICRAGRRGDLDFSTLAAANAVENDIFLQNVIAGKGGVSRFVNMDVLKREVPMERLTERAKVGPVHKTARRNRHQLATVLK